MVLAEDALGNVTTATYDILGRRRSVTAPSVGSGTPATTRFEVDLAGRVTLQTDPLGRKMRSTFDQAGRQTETEQLSVAGAVLATTTSSYDLAGQAVSMSFPDGECFGRGPIPLYDVICV